MTRKLATVAVIAAKLTVVVAAMGIKTATMTIGKDNPHAGGNES